jgi:hypothetical protein
VTEVTASDDVRGRGVGEVSELRRGALTLAGNVMAELADGTGGTFFHNSNDLDAGFTSLTEAPEVFVAS